MSNLLTPMAASPKLAKYTGSEFRASKLGGGVVIEVASA